MPITPFLNGEHFDLETTRVLSVALEMICIALRTGDCNDDVKQAIATKLIALAQAGERNPDILCEEALKDIRKPQEWAASSGAVFRLTIGTKDSELGQYADCSWTLAALADCFDTEHDIAGKPRPLTPSRRGREPRRGLARQRRGFPLGAALLSLRRPCFRKGSCVLFHIKCPECGSRIVKTGTPTAADANSEFDKTIAGIKLLGATPDTEPSSIKEQVELFCLNGHKLALEEIGRQKVEQLRKEQQKAQQ
jgi:DNA-directed RNA polymerase subunit RPC12/RpoP